MKILCYSIILTIMTMFVSCFVLSNAHAQDCMGGQFCGGNTSYSIPTLNRNVTVSLNFHSNSAMSDNVHYLWLRFFDAKNNELIKNVSFFINATKNNRVLMHELFYTKTGLMLMKFYPDSDTEKLIINGTSEPTLGGWMSKNDTLPITTSVFAENGIYHIHLEVLALDYVNELVDQNNPPKFDSWWSVDDKGHISKYENSTINSVTFSINATKENQTVASCYGYGCGQNSSALKQASLEKQLGLTGPPLDSLPSHDVDNNSWLSVVGFGSIIGGATVAISVYVMRIKR